VGAEAWMPVVRVDVCVRRSLRAFARSTVGAGTPLPVEYVDVDMAAQHGHLEVLQWAREHDCP